MPCVGSAANPPASCLWNCSSIRFFREAGTRRGRREYRRKRMAAGLTPACSSGGGGEGAAEQEEEEDGEEGVGVHQG